MFRALGWRWYRAGGFWFRQRSRGLESPTIPLESVASRLRDAGASVSIAPPESIDAEGVRRVRQELAEGRAEHHASRAAKVMGEAEDHYAVAKSIMDRIDGQPILIGHHSEKRHRREIERARRAARKGADAFSYGQELEGRARRAEQEAERLATVSVDSIESGNDLQGVFAGAMRGLKRKLGARNVIQSSTGQSRGENWRHWVVRFHDGFLTDVWANGTRITVGASIGHPIVDLASASMHDAIERVADAVRARHQEKLGEAARA